VSLRFSATVTARGLDVSLRLGEHETIALLGPNGAGKSTVLAILAGLLRPDTGYAELDGRVLVDLDDAQSRTWLPAHDRGVALLAQEPLLFPHQTALDNVAFGPRSRGEPRRRARSEARRWLAEVDAQELADRRPAQLSGGQAQRVAVARALAADPHLLLLDEPMAALDVAAAPAIRQLLRRVLHGRSAIIVTHNAIDAVLLARRVVVVDAGRVVEDGPTHEVLARPRSAFAARIAGLNMVTGTAVAQGVRRADGLVVEGFTDEPVPLGAPAVAVFSPTAVAVYLTPPGGSPRNALPGRITELEPHGAHVRVRTAELSADITAAAVAELGLAPGSDVCFVVKASEVAIYGS
jgi:molybdate transport system ATP-binding protein